MKYHLAKLRRGPANNTQNKEIPYFDELLEGSLT